MLLDDVPLEKCGFDAIILIGKKAKRDSKLVGRNHGTQMQKLYLF